MPLKIGFDAKRLFNNSTGLGNYSRTLVKNLVQLYPEHEYHLFTPSIKSNQDTEFFLSDRFIIHAPNTINPFWRSLTIPKLIEKNNLDIYHGLSHELPFSKPSSRCRLVVTFHDLIYEIYPKQFSAFDRRMYKFKYKKSAYLADQIIAISSHTKNDLIELYNIDPSKIDVLYQSFNPYYSKPKIDILLADRKYFLFVGSIIERKGIDKLIDVYSRYGDSLAPLKIVGGGGSYKQLMQQKINKNNLSDKISIISNVNNEDLRALYQNAIATLLPSIYEGFGIPVVESLSSGTPVIVSNISSLPEACGAGGILIDPLDVDSIYTAMIEIQKQEVWTHLKLQGEKHINIQFEDEKLSKELMSIYEQVLLHS